MWRYLAAKVGMSKRGGRQWQTTPKELSQDAAYQSHTGRQTGLWSLPKLARGLNTNHAAYQSHTGRLTGLWLLSKLALGLNTDSNILFIIIIGGILILYIWGKAMENYP
jgi:hypothetical protein